MWTDWERRDGNTADSFSRHFGGGQNAPALRGHGAGHESALGPAGVHRNLWTAVILRAFQDATKKGGTDESRRVRAEARGWFVNAGGDFRRVCHLAGFEPSWVRRQVLSHLD